MNVPAVSPKSKRAPRTLEAVPADQSPFSYEEVQADARDYVIVRVERIRTSMRITAQEVANMGRALTELRDILVRQGIRGDGMFTRLLRDELCMAPRTARRYMAVGAFIEAHFGNQPVPDISQSAIHLLTTQTTPGEAVIKILSRLQEGEKISIADVESTISEMRETVETTQEQLAETLTELGETKHRLDTVTAEAQRIELESHRFRDQANRAAGSLEVAKKETVLLNEEIAALKRQTADLRRQIERKATEVVEKVVEVVPDGYATLEEALAAKNAEIAKAEQRLARIADDTAAGERKAHQAKAAAAEHATAEANLQALRQDIEALLTRWPGALMASLATTPAVKKELGPVAAMLRRLADQLEGK